MPFPRTDDSLTRPHASLHLHSEAIAEIRMIVSLRSVLSKWLRLCFECGVCGIKYVPKDEFVSSFYGNRILKPLSPAYCSFQAVAIAESAP